VSLIVNALSAVMTVTARTYDENVNLLHQTLNRTYDKVIIPMESYDKPLEVMYSSMTMGADMVGISRKYYECGSTRVQ
jgi:hypothetical protein